MTLANDYSLLLPEARTMLDRDWGLFIGGEWVESLSGARMNVVDPSHGAAVTTVVDAGAADVDRAVKAARSAFEGGAWPAMRPTQREALLLRLADLISAEADVLAQVETVNSGKLVGNTRVIDADFSVHTLRHAAGWPTRIAGRTMELGVPYMPGVRFSGATIRQPVGVVAAITPWNVPLCMAAAVKYRRKRAGHLQSKGRFLAAQILAMLEGDVWLSNARAANAAAAELGGAAQGRLLYPVEANEVFLRCTAAEREALRTQGFGFYDWGTDAARLVTAWDADAAHVSALARAIAAL